MEKAIIVGVNIFDNQKNFEDELKELEALCLACEIEVLDFVKQNLDAFNNNTYIGKGKIDELKLAITSLDADCVVFNDELTPSQISNLEKSLEITLYDRTYIILEIFKRRAKTKEALLQVELASLKYSLPRLIGLRKGLSRQRGTGGGFAHGRGAGETKLELDRRITTDSIASIKKELEELTKLRKQQRNKRKKHNMNIVCLVGYTNSGKSSTLNAIMDYSKSIKKTVLQKDMLFATLETSTRLIQTADNFEFLLTDTVGFINKLPHQLIEAFKSTLEEITEADLIVHVIDATNENYSMQIETTKKVLEELGATNIPTIYCFNKMDLIDDYFYIPYEYDNAIRISCLNHHNIDKLILLIRDILEKDYETVEVNLEYINQGAVEKLRNSGYLKSVEYFDDYIKVVAKVPSYLKDNLLKKGVDR